MSVRKTRSRTMTRAWGMALAGALAVTTFAAPEPADAGWRELGFVFVQMDESGAKDSRACYTNIRKSIAGEEGGDIVHVRLARETMARKLGAETTKDWRTAPRDAFEPLVKWEPSTWRGYDGKTIGSGYIVDAWVLIDCQPSKEILDVVTVAPVTGSVMRLHFGQREITKNIRAYAKSFIVAHAWADWSP